MVYLTTWTAGIRDCQTSDGYLRDHQDNATDNCDYKCGWMKCGDVCINAKEGKWCKCGTWVQNCQTVLKRCPEARYSAY